MHEVLDALEEINLDHFEYAMLLKDTNMNSSTFKMFVPKIMPAVKYKEADTWDEEIKTGIFVNDKECKIEHSKKIKCQNFLTIERHTNTDFSSRADKHNIIKKDTKFIIQSMYGNVKDLYVEKVL